MKIYKEEIAGSDKKRILFAIGEEELELILGILKTAQRFFPSGERWKPDGNRLTGIINAFRKYYKKQKS